MTTLTEKLAELKANAKKTPCPPHVLIALLDAVEELEKLVPIVEAAFWDHYSAFSMPGAGYDNKAQSMAADLIGRGWAGREGYEKWKQKMTQLEKILDE